MLTQAVTTVWRTELGTTLIDGFNSTTDKSAYFHYLRSYQSAINRRINTEFLSRMAPRGTRALGLYVIVTASPSRWTSILQVEFYQWVLHVYVPRYLERWVSTEGRVRVSY